MSRRMGEISNGFSDSVFAEFEITGYNMARRSVRRQKENICLSGRRAASFSPEVGKWRQPRRSPKSSRKFWTI